MGCCGPIWSTTIPPSSTLQEEDNHIRTETEPVLMNVNEGPVSSARLEGMNLATALAAERNSRVGINAGPTSTGGRVKSLMRLIEETDGHQWNKRRKRDVGRDSSDWMCCVCRDPFK